MVHRFQTDNCLFYLFLYFIYFFFFFFFKSKLTTSRYGKFVSSTPTVSFTSLNNIMGNLFLNYLYFKIILRLLLYLRKHKQSMFTQCIHSLFFVLLNASPPLLCAFIHCNQHCAFVFRNSPISPFVRTHNRSLKNLERILSTQRNNWISPYQSAHYQDYPIQPVLAVGVYPLSGRGLWGPLL